MRHLILIGLAVLVTACGGGGSGGGSAGAPDPGITNPVVVPPAVTRDVVVNTGHNYSCVLDGNDLICWGSNPTLGMTASPTVIISGATVTDLHLYDNTICIGGTVTMRPVGHNPGAVTYCFGDANIASGGFAGQPVLFSPPVQQGDISPELVTWMLPYSAADLAFAAYMGLGTVLDSSNDVTSTLVTCTQNGSAWDCGSFTL